MLDNRRQQLNVDLAAPVRFSEAYQGFIAQVHADAVQNCSLQVKKGTVPKWQVVVHCSKTRRLPILFLTMTGVHASTGSLQFRVVGPLNNHPAYVLQQSCL